MSNFATLFSFFLTLTLLQVTEELANRGKKVMSKVIARPSRWDEVQFRAIPLQEGEDVGSAEVTFTFSFVLIIIISTCFYRWTKIQ